MKNTAAGTDASTAMEAITEAAVGRPAANDRAKERPITASTGSSEASNPALSGLPENTEHKTKNTTTAAIKEITKLFFKNRTSSMGAT